jgi:hypothetical protein
MPAIAVAVLSIPLPMKMARVMSTTGATLPAIAETGDRLIRW